MKKVVLIITVLFSVMCLNAQSEIIRSEIDFFAEKLNIMGDQSEKLTALISKKYSDLANISGIQSTEEAKFREKRIAIYRLTENSIRLILNEDQLALWKEYKTESRIKNANRIKELQAVNASKEDLKDAQYGIVN